MKGHVDPNGRALLAMEIRPAGTAQPVAVMVWVDTGFTADLVLPQRTIDALALPHSGSVDAILADGSQVQLDTHTCLINWFGTNRRLEVVANDGEFPLLGVGLLLGLELTINYHTMEVELTLP
jgi:clan AA aspartic protease